MNPQGGRLAETVGRDGTALLKVLLKAGHQSPRQDCFSGDGTAGGRLAETVGRDETALLKVLLKAGVSEVSPELF